MTNHRTLPRTLFVNFRMDSLCPVVAMLIAIVILGCLLAVPVHGQTLPTGELVTHADAIIEVEVDFVPYGDLVLLLNVLRGDRRELSNLNDLLGPCVPGRAALRTLLQEVAEKDVRAPVYRKAYELATYSVVVFLERTGETLEPICGNGNHSTENWVSDPRYIEWRRRFDAILK